MSIVLHIPHASRLTPEEVKGQFVLTEQALEREVNLITDHFTDWILVPLGVPQENQVVAPISRLVVDMERFSDDKLEVMSKVGMGVIYEKGSQLQQIRRELSSSEKQSLINNYYTSHHQKLEERTERLLEQHGQVIIIDVHSYPRVALPYERDHSQARPEICIGSCGYHTPKVLEKYLVEAFQHEGFDVGLNTPFAGTLIPSKYWQKDKRVIGFMIEVRRDVYMDESSFSLSTHSDEAREKICDALKQSLDLFFALKEA